MVTVSLRGGTGNQFWIYAFGQALKSLGNEIRFDRSPLDNDETRAYTLHHWNCDVPFGPRTGEVIQEPDLLYHPELLKKYEKDVTMDGYWQSPKYLTGVGPQLRKDFTLRSRPSEQTLSVAREIENCNSCFLHVRRTDNLSIRGASLHGLGSLAYWDKAVQEIYRRVSEAKFFVFSDDIAWCKQQPFFSGATFVGHNSTGVTIDSEYALTKTDSGSEHEDLWLMRRCKHAIMATSTFSHWAAWLGAHSNGGVVVRPYQWFVRERNAESRDMHPPGWIAV